MRQLSLHASALNDAEYELYTSSLQDLAWTEDQGSSSGSTSGQDDAYYEKMRVGVREVRAWIRGRYANVATSSIDEILRLFSPSMRQLDTLSGGQFFAALRLVVHVESGMDLDRGLAFSQAHPSTVLRYSSPERQPPDSLAPPSFPASTPPTSQTLDHHSPQSVNPFTPSNSTADPDPHLHPLPQRTDLSKSPTSSSQGPRAIHNPFIHGNSPYLQEKSSMIYSSERSPSPPKLPPRKPFFIPPPVHPVLLNPRRNSLLSQSKRKSVSPTRRSTAPPRAFTQTPPPPATTLSPLSPLSSKRHSSSTLMQESLQANKTAQAAKKHTKVQESEPVLQVLKSSAVISGGHSLARARVASSFVVVGTSVHNRSRGRSRSASPDKVGHEAEVDVERPPSVPSEHGEGPPLPRRRMHQQQPSPPGSVSSFEHITSPSATNEDLHPTPTPFQPPLPPPSPSYSNSHHYSSQNPYHKRPLPIPGGTAPAGVVHSSPHASPTRTYSDFPIEPYQDRDSNTKPKPHAKPPHFRYRTPSSSSSASYTFINHADAAATSQDKLGSTSTAVLSSSPPATPTKPAFPFYNPPAPTRSPFHNAAVPEPAPLTPTKSPPPPRTPSKFQTLSLSPNPFADALSRSPFSTTPITPQSGSSPTARIFRSKSLHHPSPPLPALPAPSGPGIGGVRRKRPESVLVLSSGEILFGGNTRDASGVVAGSSGTLNHDRSVHQNQGAESKKSDETLSGQVSFSNSSTGEPSPEHRRSSLSRSISVSSSSSNHTSVSQPVPDAYSHSHSNPYSPTGPRNHFRYNGNIQRTIAKFDALQPRPGREGEASAGWSRKNGDGGAGRI